MGENMKECRYCCEKINDKATICNKCGRFQSLFRQYTQALHGTLVLSTIMVILAILGVLAAKQDHIAAKEALDKANLVEQATQEVAKTLIEINYLKGKTINQFGTKQVKRVQKIIQDDLNRTLQLVFPDDKERNAFIQGLDKKYQQTMSSDK